MASPEEQSSPPGDRARRSWRALLLWLKAQRYGIACAWAVARHSCCACGLWLAGLLIVVGAVFYLGGGGPLPRDFPKEWGAEPFNREEWRRLGEPGVKPEPRARMLRSVCRDYPLIGMTRSEVLDLLGPPSVAVDATHHPVAPLEARRLLYDIGFPPLEPFGSDDFLEFALEFGAGGAVRRVWIGECLDDQAWR